MLIKKDKKKSLEKDVEERMYFDKTRKNWKKSEENFKKKIDIVIKRRNSIKRNKK